ncbi:MAG: ABC transporter permease [Oscillospiraceae bacterium]
MSEQKRKLKTSVKDPLGRGGGLSNFAYAMLSVAGVLSFFLIWQLLIEFGIVSGRYLSKPTEIVALFIYKMTNTNPDGSTIPVSTLASLEVAIVGLLLAIVTGVPIGLLMGWYKGFRKFIKPVFEILRPIPPISWIPLTILWLGIGIKAKAFIIFFAAFIPCVINSATGIEQTNKTLINVAKTCGASNVEIFFKVGIPSALPIMFAGIRVALGNAWATLVAAEMLAANSGLGYMILMGRNYARADIVILGMVLIGALGALFTGTLGFIERRVIKWRT